MRSYFQEQKNEKTIAQNPHDNRKKVTSAEIPQKLENEQNQIDFER
jgi:hypothetical protein